MDPDRELLRQYANDGNQAAFAEVVRRHTDLVYSAALRLVAGDAHLAQDVAQNVFTALARKAGSLAQRENLLGWLHTTTRYAASVAVRGERRRRTHEQEAGTTMHQDSATTEMDWMQLQPALDEAVGRLHAQDREAVLLRFFQGKSHREVGAELGVNEVLARKRVDRALEKLRVHLTRRGVTLSSALIAGAITTHSVQAAPAGLATSLSSAALAHAAHTGAAASFLKGLAMTTKTKTAIVVAVMLAILAIPILQFWKISQVDEQNYALAKQNNALHAQVDRLGMQLRKVKTVMIDPALKQTDDPNDYLPLSKDTIMGLRFGPSDSHLDLDTLSIALLGMTPTEASQVQDVLDGIKTRIQTRNRTSLQEVAPGKVADTEALRFMKEHPGQEAVYEIPPMSDEEMAAYQQWVSDGLAKALGSERGGIMLQKIAENETNDSWLTPGKYRLFVFSDSLAADGQTPKNVSGSFEPVSNGELEGQVSSIVKALHNGTPPPPPVPEPSRQYREIRSNLEDILLRAHDYMDDNHVTEVSYQQLTVGPDPVIEPCLSIAGESYDKIVVHQSDGSLSLDVPGVGLVEF